MEFPYTTDAQEFIYPNMSIAQNSKRCVCCWFTFRWMLWYKYHTSNFQARNCRHVLGATHQNKRPTCFLITGISFCLEEIHPFLLYPGCCCFMGLDLHISLSKEDTAITLELSVFQGQVHLRRNASVFLRWHKWVNAYCVWQATLEFGIDNQPQFLAGIWRTLSPFYHGCLIWVLILHSMLDLPHLLHQSQNCWNKTFSWKHMFTTVTIVS